MISDENIEKEIVKEERELKNLLGKIDETLWDVYNRRKFEKINDESERLAMINVLSNIAIVSSNISADLARGMLEDKEKSISSTSSET